MYFSCLYSGLKIQDCPPDLPVSGADSIYSYENLPSKHQRKYVYASRFIQLVRAKTPKITYYSPKGKCDLMENLENFELTFYNGEKIVRSSENNIKIFDCDGNTVSMSNENDAMRSLWQHYQQCFEHCKTLERTLSSIHTEGDCFPIIVGRRPASAPALSTSTSRMPGVSINNNSLTKKKHTHN